MSAIRRVLGGLQAAELALIVFLVAVTVAAVALFVQPSALEALLRLPPAGQLTGGQGGPGPSPDRR